MRSHCEFINMKIHAENKNTNLMQSKWNTADSNLLFENKQNK